VCTEIVLGKHFVLYWVYRSRIRRAGHVACIGERMGSYGVLVGKPERQRYLEDLGVNGTMILKWIIQKWDGETLIGLMWLRDR
jgi:hypothetical protein